MYRDEQVRPLLVRDRGASFERYESVVLASVYDLGAQTGFQQTTEALSHIEHHVLLQQAIWPDRACVVASVASINHDLANLQSQRTNERTVAAGGWASLARFIPGF